MLHPFRWQGWLPALHVAMQFGLYHLQIHGVWRIVSEDSLPIKAGCLLMIRTQRLLLQRVTLRVR